MIPSDDDFGDSVHHSSRDKKKKKASKKPKKERGERGSKTRKKRVTINDTDATVDDR